MDIETNDQPDDLRSTIAEVMNDANPDGGDTGDSPLTDPPDRMDRTDDTPGGADDTQGGAGEGRARDDKGRFAKADRELTDEAQEKARQDAEGRQGKPQEGQQGQKPGEKPQEAQKPQEGQKATRAPQSWKPLAREEWAKIPPAAQGEILRLEGETRRVMQESAQARDFHQKFHSAIQTFMPMIQADNSDPITATTTLLRSALVLRSGSPQARVGMVANMIKAFMPRHEWDMLDKALAGMDPGQGPVDRQQGQGYDPRLDPLLERLAASERAQAQQTQARLGSLLEDAAKEEFWDDVKLDVADILEMSAKRGLTLSVKDAYNRACNYHPEISKVMAQREAARRANPRNGSTRAAQAAASSVRTNPATPVRSGTAAESLQDDIRESIRELQDR